MAPKGGNAKKEGGRAKKAENEVSPSYYLGLSPLSSRARIQRRRPAGQLPTEVQITDD
jgi:hypothetical protein